MSGRSGRLLVALVQRPQRLHLDGRVEAVASLATLALVFSTVHGLETEAVRSSATGFATDFQLQQNAV